MRKIAIIDETKEGSITIIPVFNFYDLSLWIGYAQEHALDIIFLGEKEVAEKSGVNAFINEPIDKPYRVVFNNICIFGIVYIDNHYELMTTSFKKIPVDENVLVKFIDIE